MSHFNKDSKIGITLSQKEIKWQIMMIYNYVHRFLLIIKRMQVKTSNIILFLSPWITKD